MKPPKKFKPMYWPERDEFPASLNLLVSALMLRRIRPFATYEDTALLMLMASRVWYNMAVDLSQYGDDVESFVRRMIALGTLERNGKRTELNKREFAKVTYAGKPLRVKDTSVMFIFGCDWLQSAYQWAEENGLLRELGMAISLTSNLHPYTNVIMDDCGLGPLRSPEESLGAEFESLDKLTALRFGKGQRILAKYADCLVINPVFCRYSGVRRELNAEEVFHNDEGAL